MEASERLYFEDPEALEFDATVLACTPAAHAGYEVRLDRTAFYPTSGGQPHDTGHLGDARVTDVIEDEAGRVVHLCDAPLPLGRTSGRVDAIRRRDHTQQHSGQHLLSATCLALLQRPTAAFHLGAERSSIDLPGPRLAVETLAAIESRANALVREARPVRARFVSLEEAQALRAAPPEVVGAVRIVEIEDWDRNACCGTHVRNTSAIGVVKIVAQERVGNTSRVHFVCGERALAAFDRAQATLDGLTRLLGRPLEELAATIELLQVQAKARRKEFDRVQAEWAASVAEFWLTTAPRASGIPIVAQMTSPVAALETVAAAVVARGGIALLGRIGTRADLLFQRPTSVQLDLRPIMQTACATIGGRGGGAASRAQGAGTRLDAIATALADAATAVARGLGTSF